MTAFPPSSGFRVKPPAGVGGPFNGSASTATNRAPPSRICGRERLDAPGYTAVILQGAALTVADTLLIPVRPRTFDVWSVEQMAGLVREARVVNDGLRARRPQRRRSAGKDNDEAAAALAAADGLAWALPTAAAAGRSVVEQAGQDPKAAPS